ncbi:threonine synthase [Halosimplex litoreum]|uniref:Threonine synthase n=1 Tax=Halosimplex litoreum TaxID=1198301 RepID=A0A7T3KV68_9EURY|nr:threonine synthase [Halosimplex litoreum]QPV62982.1 threonine synthase [Halosimplex litoreum]
MTLVEALACERCGRRYAPADVEYTCPEHDGVGGILDVRYEYDAVSDELAGVLDGPIGDLWTYEPLLPVDGDPVRLGAGGTDLLDAPALGDALGVDALVKNETTNPTGSNKDRGSAVAVSRARQQGHEVVACASTGNAAASLAGYAARAGLDCRIFVPADLPEAKAVQPRLYGATVLGVDGTYADAYELCREVSAERGWYNRNAAMNPYAVEGKRTLGFELAEQAPAADWVVMPMGNGCSLAGVWKGLREFERLGVVDDTPRLLGVQAEGATAIYDRFVAESDDSDAGAFPIGEREDGADTTADSIDVSVPHNAGKACRALVESGGDAVVVSDDEILDAQRLLGECEGVFAEPASAAAVAGVRAAVERGTVAPGEQVVTVATGTGLKDSASAREAVDDVISVDAAGEGLPEDL